MEYVYLESCIILFYCDESQVEDIREFARKYFRPLPLRYRIERDYPEAGWNTPALGVPVGVSVTLFAPRGQQLHDKELQNIVRDFRRELSCRFVSIESFSKRNQYRLQRD